MTTLTQNKKKKRLTIDELRTFKGFENISDQMAEKTIRSLEQLSLFLFELFQKHNHRILKTERHEKSKSA